MQEDKIRKIMIVVAMAVILVSLAGAIKWDEPVQYDTFSSFNNSLWQNTTTLASGATGSLTVSGGNLYTFVSHGASISGSSSYTLKSILLPSYSEISELLLNVTLLASTGGAGSTGASSTLSVYGSGLKTLSCGGGGSCSLTNSSIWRLEKNGSNYDVYANGAFQSQITPSDNNVSANGDVGSTGSLSSASASFRIYVINYSYDETAMTIDLIEPENNSVRGTENVLFNFTLSTFINQMRNASFYINNLLNETIYLSNFTQENATLYSCSGSWKTCENLTDDDYATYAKASGVPASIILNYTKAGDGASWGVKDYVGSTTLEIPSDCFDYYSDVISLKVTAIPINGYQCSWECFNGTETDVGGGNIVWKTLRNVTAGSSNLIFYEENITWTNDGVETFFLRNMSKGNYNWSIYACDSDDNCKFSDLHLFSINPFTENSTYFNPITTEGQKEFFQLNLTLDGDYDFDDANFVYNGVEYSTTLNEISTRIFSLSSLINVPGVTDSTNYSFHWELELEGVWFNSSENQQQVNNITIDDCSSYTERILNFTVVDEETAAPLPNATIEAAVNIYNEERDVLVLNISGNYSSSISFCLGEQITNGSTYSMDSVVKYQEQDHATEFYNIVNATLNSSYVGSNITLYDLHLNDSTEFRVVFTGNDYLPIEDAVVYLDREYIAENSFHTVEAPLTAEDGSTILHLVRNDIRYNIRVIKDGELVANFEKIVAYCPNPDLTECLMQLSSTSSINELDYNTISGIIYSAAPLYDSSTNTVSFSFIVADGLPKEISLNVTRNDVFGNRSICTNTLNSASGTLSCYVGNLSDTTLISTVYIEGEPVLISSLDINRTDFGSTGFLIWFIVTLLFILMLGESKSWILISLMISYIGAVGLGISRGDMIGVGSAGIWIIIVTTIGVWRLNRGREQ